MYEHLKEKNIFNATLGRTYVKKTLILQYLKEITWYSSGYYCCCNAYLKKLKKQRQNGGLSEFVLPVKENGSLSEVDGCYTYDVCLYVIPGIRGMLHTVHDLITI